MWVMALGTDEYVHICDDCMCHNDAVNMMIKCVQNLNISNQLIQGMLCEFCVQKNRKIANEVKSIKEEYHGLFQKSV